MDAYLAVEENRFGQPQFASHSLPGHRISKSAAHQGYYPGTPLPRTSLLTFSQLHYFA